MVYYFIPILIAPILLSFLGMFFLQKYVRIKALMDFPNDRKVHKKIVPLYGGLVFTLVYYFFVVLFYPHFFLLHHLF